MATFYHLNGVDGVSYRAALTLDVHNELLSFTYLGKKILTIPLSDIAEVTIDENTEIRKKSGVGRALVGGAALGSAGAVAGALTAKDKKEIEAIVTMTYFPADRVKPAEITVCFDGRKNKLNYAFINSLKERLCSVQKSKKVLDFLGYLENDADDPASSVTILDENTIQSLNNDALKEYFHMIQSWFDRQTPDSISDERFEQVRTVLAVIQDETSKREQQQEHTVSSPEPHRPSYDAAQPRKKGSRMIPAFYILSAIFAFDGVVAFTESKVTTGILALVMAVMCLLAAILKKKKPSSESENDKYNINL